MNILEMKSEQGYQYVTVRFTYKDIRDIANALYFATKNPEATESCHKAHADCKLLFDMVKYGDIQPETLASFFRINRGCYQDQMEDKTITLDNVKEPRTLSKKEIDCFNSYIEFNDMPTAFGNSDWTHIYQKIVGDNVSDYAKKCMGECTEDVICPILNLEKFQKSIKVDIIGGLKCVHKWTNEGEGDFVNNSALDSYNDGFVVNIEDVSAIGLNILKSLNAHNSGNIKESDLNISSDEVAWSQIEDADCNILQTKEQDSTECYLCDYYVSIRINGKDVVEDDLKKILKDATH